MNRVEQVSALLRKQLPEVPPEKQKELETILVLDTIEVHLLQNRQAVLHASGVITTDEAMTLYHTLSHWGLADVYDKYAVLAVMRELEDPRYTS